MEKRNDYVSPAEISSCSQKNVPGVVKYIICGVVGYIGSRMEK